MLTNEVLTTKDEDVLFTPTHPDDHLATQLINIIPESEGGGRWFRLTMSFSESGKTWGNCVISIQDDKYNVISATLFPGDEDSSKEKSMLIRYLEIADNVLLIRLVISSEDLKATLIPRSIKLEQSTKQSKTAKNS